MAKRYLRLGKLLLDYIGDTKNTPSDGSDYIVYWRSGGVITPRPEIGPCTMETMLTMLFHTRHRFRKEVLSPDWDKGTFFMEYQLNRPIDETSADSIFAGLFQGLPREVYKELANTSLDMTAMFVPQPSPWSPAALLGGKKFELSNEPIAKPKPLPKVTHKAPSTLQ